MVQTTLMNQYANAYVDQNTINQMAQTAAQIVQSLGFNHALSTTAGEMISSSLVDIDSDRITVLLSQRCNGPCW